MSKKIPRLVINLRLLIVLDQNHSVLRQVDYQECSRNECSKEVLLMQDK